MPQVKAENQTKRYNGPLLTIDDLAALLKVTKATVYALNYRRTGPPFVRIGKAVRYRPESVAAWLAEREAR